MKISYEKLEDRILFSTTKIIVEYCDESLPDEVSYIDKIENLDEARLSVLQALDKHSGGCCCPDCDMFKDIAISKQFIPFDLSDTFKLNSNPTANHTIYLDFNGHTTQNTIWNAFYTGGNPIISPPLNIEGSSSSFTNNELLTIQRIWARVSEDFIPFNVNVTTEEPIIDDLIKSSESDIRWGIRVVIGGSSTQWYGSPVGGIAFVGTFNFNFNNDTPVFVFPAQLGNSEKPIAEASSHEVGHALGLNHHGRINPSEEYYAGHGSGPTGWTPIMGNPYSRELSQWSKGEYANANNSIQDDLQIITSQNGFSYRIDDYGNDKLNAKRIGDYFNLDNFEIAKIMGIIETGGDVDVFNFSYEGGIINILGNPNSIGANLDILLELLDKNFNIIYSSNPTNDINTNIKERINKGEYYIRISGINKINSYSDYGSLGQYTLIINNLKNYSVDIDEFHEKLRRNFRRSPI